MLGDQQRPRILEPQLREAAVAVRLERAGQQRFGELQLGRGVFGTGLGGVPPEGESCDASGGQCQLLRGTEGPQGPASRLTGFLPANAELLPKAWSQHLCW